jgi:hypothetical protein
VSEQLTTEPGDLARAARLLRDARPVEQRLPAEVALYLLAHLQLALRHPGLVDSKSSRVARLAAVQLGDALVARVPELRDIVAAGWDPAQDVSW